MFIHEAILPVCAVFGIPALVCLVIWIRHMRCFINYLKSNLAKEELSQRTGLETLLSTSQGEIKCLLKIIRTGKSKEFCINEIKDEISATKAYLERRDLGYGRSVSKKFCVVIKAKRTLRRLKKLLKQVNRRK